MRDYFLWLLSETINATNIPKEIISVNALTMSIGKHLPPREVSHRRLTADRQCYQPPHAKPVYWINYNILLSLILYLIAVFRSEEHTSELQSRGHLVCRRLLEI